MSFPSQFPTPESNGRQVGLPSSFLGLSEAQQRFIHVDQRIPRTFCDFPMTAKDVVSGVCYESTGYRVTP